MPRPKSIREIEELPIVNWFKPVGIPLRQLNEMILTLDEIETIRLADAEGLYHAEVARRLNVSRSTASRILASARRKIAVALLQGYAIRLEGGVVKIRKDRKNNNIQSNSYPKSESPKNVTKEEKQLPDLGEGKRVLHPLATEP